MFQVYIPLNFGGCHWVYAQLDLSAWHLSIFDSQHSANTLERVMNFCRPLTIYIPHLLSATEFWTRRGMMPRTDDRTVSRVTGVPQQASELVIVTLLYWHSLSISVLDSTCNCLQRMDHLSGGELLFRSGMERCCKLLIYILLLFSGVVNHLINDYFKYSL